MNCESTTEPHFQGTGPQQLPDTSVYWILLYEILQARGFEVVLVDPRKRKSVPGRKSDVADCQWLRQLHTYGLLAAAFRPDEQTCVLCAYLRQWDDRVPLTPPDRKLQPAKRKH